MLSKKQGFTLIEVLVVVLIVGILAAVAVPQYQKAVYKSRYATLPPLVHTIVSAQEVYYLANGKYATNLQTLDIDLPGGKLDTSTDIQNDYPWGECHITLKEGTINAVVCRNTQINMGYTVFVQHAADTTNAGTRQRYVYGSAKEGDLPIQTAICRAETGLSTKTSVGTLASSGLKYMMYKYPTF